MNNVIESKIYSEKPKDMEIIKNMKEEVHSIEDKRDLAAARRYFAKAQLEGEKPTHFFCSSNKKRMEKAQFEELHVVEKKPNGKEDIKIVKEQKEVEWDVRKFYWNLYKVEETNINITDVH